MEGPGGNRTDHRLRLTNTTRTITFYQIPLIRKVNCRYMSFHKEKVVRSNTATIAVRP